MSIHIVVDRTTGAQVSRLHADLREAHRDADARHSYCDVVTMQPGDLLCLATDECTEAATTVINVPGWQASDVTHHIPACRTSKCINRRTVTFP